MPLDIPRSFATDDSQTFQHRRTRFRKRIGEAAQPPSGGSDRAMLDRVASVAPPTVDLYREIHPEGRDTRGELYLALQEKALAFRDAFDCAESRSRTAAGWRVAGLAADVVLLGLGSSMIGAHALSHTAAAAAEAGEVAGLGGLSALGDLGLRRWTSNAGKKREALMDDFCDARDLLPQISQIGADERSRSAAIVRDRIGEGGRDALEDNARYTDRSVHRYLGKLVEAGIEAHDGPLAWTGLVPQASYRRGMEWSKAHEVALYTASAMVNEYAFIGTVYNVAHRSDALGRLPETWRPADVLRRS